MSGMGRRLRDLLIAMAISAVLLLALEGLARWAGAGAPDLPPLPPRTPGVFRILALGGSTVLGVPDGSQGFVAQLERSLRRAAPGRPLEVLNLARSGIGSRSVRARLEHALALSGPPDLVIVLMGHNEFLEPRPGPLQRLRDRSRLAGALGAWFEADPAPDAPMPDQLAPVDPQGTEANQRRRAFAENLDAVVALARGAGVPLFLCTAPSNLADWPPAHRRVEGALPEQSVDEIRALLDRGRPQEALDRVRGMRASRPDDAMLFFLEASALRDLGRLDQAREAFVRARARDPIPRRAFDAFNQAVRAKQGPDVRVIDVAQRFADHAESGLVGFDLVCDNCHPTPLGNALIAREIALALRDEGHFLSRGDPVPALDVFVARLEASQGDVIQRRRSRLRWLLSNAIYAMKTPFFNFEASRRYLDQALELAPGDWRIHANLATLSLLDGDTDEGRRSLVRATALKGSPLDPDDRDLLPYLQEALAGSGLSLRTDAGGS